MRVENSISPHSAQLDLLYSYYAQRQNNMSVEQVMTANLPFFGRDAELALLHGTWQKTTQERTPHIITFVAETGVGKSRIIQQFYNQLTIDPTWDPDNFWPDAFQSHTTQLSVNPDFPSDFTPSGRPRFLWIGMRWHNAEEQNVANSLALPIIKEQLIQFEHRNNTVRPRWQRIINAGKDEARKLFTIRGALNATLKIVPGGDFLGTVWEYGEGIAKAGAGITPAPPTLPEQLMDIFHSLFSQTDTPPIILWLDDAQWMDAEAQAFFTQLTHTARLKHWPLMLIATSWPAEWRAFPADFFLKHDSAVAYDLSNAADTELRQLLHSAFAHLPDEHIRLIINKAGGNFLTMIENITELRTKPRYFFIEGDSTQPLSTNGIEEIHKWESTRHRRIEQRFHGFDNDIQDFLARASHAGLNTQFLQRVLLRCRDIYPNEADVANLIHRCQEALAVIIPVSSSLHEFRDRGYFAVAQQHFTHLLQQNEFASLRSALIDELTERVQSVFDENGNLCDAQIHTTSLRAASLSEQHMILNLALTLLPKNTVIHVQALVAIVRCHAEADALTEIPKLLQSLQSTDGTDYFNDINWTGHAGGCVSWDALDVFADALYDAGALTQVERLHTNQLNYWRTQHTTPDTLNKLSTILYSISFIHQDNGDLPVALQYATEALDLSRQLVQDRGTLDDLHDLSVALNYVGRIHQHNGDLTSALQAFNEALTIRRQLVQDRGTPDDLQWLSITLNNVGNIHQDNGDLLAVLRCYNEVLELSYQLVQDRRTLNDYYNLYDAFYNLGIIYKDIGSITVSLQYFTESLDLARQIVQTRGNPNDMQLLFSAIHTVGCIVLNNGDRTTALKFFTESLDLARQIMQIRGNSEDLLVLSLSFTIIGRICQESGNFTAANQYLNEHLTIVLQIKQIYDIPVTLNNLTEIAYTVRRDNQEVPYSNTVLQFFTACLNLSRQIVQTQSITLDLQILINTIYYVGETYRKNGDFITALQCFFEIISFYQHSEQTQCTPEDLQFFFNVLDTIGNIYQENSDITTAQQYYNEHLTVARQFEQTRGTPDDTSNLAKALYVVGIFCQKNSDITSARQFFQESLDLTRQLVQTRGTSEDISNLANALYVVGHIYYENNDLTMALQYATESCNTFCQLAQTQGTPDDFRIFAVALTNVGRIHYVNGNLTAALQYTSEALALSRQLVQSHGTLDDLQGLFVGLTNIGIAHQENGDLEIAQQHLSEAFELTHQINVDLDQRHDICTRLNDIYQIIGNQHMANQNFDCAFEYFKLAKMMKEQLAILH